MLESVSTPTSHFRIMSNLPPIFITYPNYPIHATATSHFSFDHLNIVAHELKYGIESNIPRWHYYSTVLGFLLKCTAMI